MDDQLPVVAIDGPAGSGKSTVARNVARRLGYTFLDTGALYRAVALLAQRRNVSWENGEQLGEMLSQVELSIEPAETGCAVFADGDDVSEELRSEEISRGASKVSRHPQVRQALLELQRSFVTRGPLVAEGRDMATVVFPQAALKIYLDASVDVRAQRRYQQMLGSGQPADLEEIRRAAQVRDQQDSTRAVAPLACADDATLVDTSDLNIDQVVDKIVALARARITSGR